MRVLLAFCGELDASLISPTMRHPMSSSSTPYSSQGCPPMYSRHWHIDTLLSCESCNHRATAPCKHSPDLTYLPESSRTSELALPYAKDYRRPSGLQEYFRTRSLVRRIVRRSLLGALNIMRLFQAPHQASIPKEVLYVVLWGKYQYILSLQNIPGPFRCMRWPDHNVVGVRHARSCDARHIPTCTRPHSETH